MKLLDDLLNDGEKVCYYRYRTVKLPHLAAGFSYGIECDWMDESGQKMGSFVLPDVSCDYIFVTRLAAKCTAAQLDPDHMLELLNKHFI